MKKFIVLLFLPIVSSLKLQVRNGGCSASNKCTRCQGHCNQDNQCGETGKIMKCYKRAYTDNQVPGCEMGGSGDRANTNYCYEVCPAGTALDATVGGTGCKAKIASVLASNNEHCGSVTDGSLDIWVNTAIAANEIFDVLASNFKTGDITADSGTINGVLKVGELDFTKLSGKLDGNTNISPATIGGALLSTKAVTTAKLDDNAVTSAKLANNAVTSAKIANNAVTAAKIANNAVTAAKIATDAVTAAKIAANAVGASELNNGASFTVKGLTSTGAITANDNLYAADNAFEVSDRWQGGKINNWAKVTLKGHLRVQDSPTETQLGIGTEMGWQVYFKNADWDHPSWSTNWGSDAIAIWCPDGAIHSQTYIGASDKRIKKDIRPLKDNESLEILRQLDTVAYKYRDVVKRGGREVIGFIAQDVNKTIPAAVTIHKDYIPNELREIELEWEYVGTGYEMQLSKETLEPGRYKFILYSEQGEQTYYLETKDGKTFLDEYGDTFISTKKYKSTALLYGKEIDDFMSIDKQKIFAVAYSALQQVDKNQQVLQQKVNELEQTIASLTERLNKLESK